MAELTTRRSDGTDGASITVDDATFAVKPNVPLMHQVVTAQLAAARSGTQSTKTRAEVSGGGAKPFKQKGTGRSRQGTTRAPQWTGGGVALGPKPRSYRQRTPKKMVKAALRSALSDRFAEGHVVVLEGGYGFTEAKTRQAVALLAALNLEGRVLVVVDREDETTIKAFRNLVGPQLILAQELNAYDVLCNDWVLFTDQNLPKAKVATDDEGDQLLTIGGRRLSASAEDDAIAGGDATAESDTDTATGGGGTGTDETSEGVQS